MKTKDLMKALQYLRAELNPYAEIQQLLLFLEVIQSGERGVTLSELTTLLDLSLPGVSRNVKWLSKYMQKGEVKGYGVLRVEPDLYERRKLNVLLTDKGRKVALSLARILDRGETDYASAKVEE